MDLRVICNFSYIALRHVINTQILNCAGSFDGVICFFQETTLTTLTREDGSHAQRANEHRGIDAALASPC